MIRDRYDVLIICGDARGTAELSKKYAVNRKYGICGYPSNWDGYGRSAGIWRNELMVSQLSLYRKNGALFFVDGVPDGNSDGNSDGNPDGNSDKETWNCIRQTAKAGVPTRIWNFREKRFVKYFTGKENKLIKEDKQ